MSVRPIAAPAALALVLTFTTGAQAHPFALSAFDAYTEGRDIRFDFKLDATSVVDLVNRTLRTEPLVTIPEIPRHQAILFDYVLARFKLTNTDLPCQPRRPTTLTVNETISKVLLEVRYRCPTDLGSLVIDSTLFHDELTPHDMVGNFHHLRALERYFLNRTSHQAKINVPGLRQVMPSVIDTNSGFRTATPPPGAFDNAARESLRLQDQVIRPSRPADGASGGGNARGWRGFWHFIHQGLLHILGGLDHVLFVVSLIIAVRTRRELLIIITSFTIAHSITLVLGSLGLVYMSPRLAEPLIALSIIYVAAENILRRDRESVRLSRPRVTFAFGLVHGFGFSSVLRDLGFGSGELAPLVVGFNLGVELGQLAIVLPLFPLVAWLRRRPERFGQIANATNAGVALVACWWFIERLRG